MIPMAKGIGSPGQLCSGNNFEQSNAATWFSPMSQPPGRTIDSDLLFSMEAIFSGMEGTPTD
jgi:hypothetical protein